MLCMTVLQKIDCVTAFYFLVFLCDRRESRRGNRERTGRQRKTEDLTGYGVGIFFLHASLANPTPIASLAFFFRVREWKGC